MYGESASAYAELCAGALELADEVIAIVVGDAGAAASVADLGVSVRHVPYDGERLLDDYWPVVCDVIAGLEAELVLVRASKRVRALVGLLAVKLGAVVASDASGLVVSEAGLGYQVLRYGGATVQVCHTKSPLVAVVGAGLYVGASPAPGGSVTVVEAVAPASGVRLVSRAPKVEQSVDLSAASVVIGVGRGIGSVENVGVAAGVAKSIGAELACSRPIAEGVGWLPKSRYLGVSGAVIQPDVYLALGISGQVQHMVGVNGAATIVAINKDKSAPIFHHCDLSLVADLSAALPTLADQLA